MKKDAMNADKNNKIAGLSMPDNILFIDTLKYRAVTLTHG